MSDRIKWKHYTDGTDEVSVEASQAYKEGHVAYGRHYIDDCPYEDGSEEYDDWIDGYQDAGVEEILQEPFSKNPPNQRT